MDAEAELRQIRATLLGVRDGMSRGFNRRPSRSPARVGRVFAETSLPTSANLFYAMHPVDVTSPDTEGGSATFTEDTGSTFHSRVLRNVPAAGTYLWADSADWRWHSELPTAPTSTHPIAGCACTSTPDVITLVKTGAGKYVQNCTFQYQTAPSGYAAGTGWWSNAEFSDGTDNYRLVLTCRLTVYAVDVAYTVASGLSTAGPFNIVTWSIGASGNTCLPLHMHNGLTISATESSFGLTDAELNS